MLELYGYMHCFSKNVTRAALPKLSSYAFWSSERQLCAQNLCMWRGGMTKVRLTSCGCVHQLLRCQSPKEGQGLWRGTQSPTSANGATNEVQAQKWHVCMCFYCFIFFGVRSNILLMHVPYAHATPVSQVPFHPCKGYDMMHSSFF